MATGTVQETLQRICDVVNERLEVGRLVPTDVVSDKYEDERWNNRPLLRLEVRDEFRPFVDMQNDDFRQEFKVLREIGDQTENDGIWSGALVDDDFGYSWPEYLGQFGVCHYLVDMNRVDEILAAAERQPALTAEERADVMLQYTDPI
jgi:hypothetical protein